MMEETLLRLIEILVILCYSCKHVTVSAINSLLN